MVDEAEARLRGIERDLHDGAQVRLAALAMTLGEIKENLEQSVDPAAQPNWPAPRTATPRRPWPSCGTWPGAFTLPCWTAACHGAGGAGGGQRGPGHGDGGIARRPSPAIEAIAYFCAAELLANAAKHSRRQPGSDRTYANRTEDW